ncbi:MAG: RNA polymerase sigma factor [Solirubrobacterales bacterium]
MGVSKLSTSRVQELCDADFDAATQEDATERELVRKAIKRAQAGDMDAIRLLYAHFARDVFRWVRTMVRDSHEAEDVTQAVFLKLITVIDKYEERPDVPFGAWIRKVARNCALDHIRANQQTPSEDIDLRCESGHAEFERRRDICRAIYSLPKEQRDVIVLRHIRGLSPLEIAVILGKSESSIHGLHHRGRLNLRVSLTRLGTTPVVAQRVVHPPTRRRRGGRTVSSPQVHHRVDDESIG